MSSIKITLAAAMTALLVVVVACTSRPVSPETAIHDASDAMRSALTKVVGDSKRLSSLLDQVDQMEMALRQQSEDLTSLSTELHALNADYDAPREQFESRLKQYQERTSVRFDRIGAAHFAMVRELDEAEWKRVVHLEHEALAASGTPDAAALSGEQP